MAWSATAGLTTGNNGSRIITITYVDDTKNHPIIVDSYDPFSQQIDDDFLADQAFRKIVSLDARDLSLESITLGPISPQIKVVIPPTKDQLAQSKYISDSSKLQSMQDLVKIGALAADDSALTALQDIVKSEFKPEYVGL